MVKIYKKYIWWNLINENKPTRNFLNIIENEMEENNDLKVNFVNYNNVEIVSKDLDITFILIIHKNKKYYYIVEGIKKILNNGYLLDLKLDLWCTFGLKVYDYLLENNNKILCERTHKFDPKSTQYDDELLNNVPIQYESIDLLRYQYPIKNINGVNCYYNSDIAIEEDAINSCFYYVFKDSDESNNYLFIPVLKYDVNNVKIYNNKGKLYKKFIFWINDYKNYLDGKLRDKQSYRTADILEGNKIVKSYDWNLDKLDKFLIDNPNIIKKWYYSKGGVYNVGIDNYIYLNDLVFFSSGNYLTKNFYSNSNVYQFSSPFNKPYFDKNFYFNGNNISYIKDNGEIDIIDTFFVLELYDNSEVNYQQIDVDNNIYELEQIKKLPEFSNKFLGIYFLPNILEVPNLWRIKKINNKKILTIKFGIEFNDIVIKLPKIQYENNLYFNKPIISNLNVLKKIEYKFFNNKIDLSKLYSLNNNENFIALSGKINFTNKANLFCKFYMLSIKDSIIEYPDTLPAAYDEYLNYVNATRNSANTSYNIIKQTNIKNGILNGISSLFNLSSINKDNMINNIVSAGIGVADSISSPILNVSNFEKKLRASYKDKENILGTKIINSPIEDAMWVSYYTKKGQFNLVEFSNLSINSIILLNNIIFLYGEFYPRYENFTDIINNEFMKNFNFTFIKLDKYYLSLIINNNIVERQYIKDVLDIFDNGIRLIDNVNYFDLVGEENA